MSSAARRVLVDTNVLLSALVFPRGVSASAFWRVVTEERLVLTEWVLAEARDVVSRKWPDRAPALEALFSALDAEMLPLGSSGFLIRDAADQPIVDAAITGGVDIILTGDKDFHALGLVEPRVLDPRAFLDLSD